MWKIAQVQIKAAVGLHQVPNQMAQIHNKDQQGYSILFHCW